MDDEIPGPLLYALTYQNLDDMHCDDPELGSSYYKVLRCYFPRVDAEFDLCMRGRGLP